MPVHEGSITTAARLRFGSQTAKIRIACANERPCESVREAGQPASLPRSKRQNGEPQQVTARADRFNRESSSSCQRIEDTFNPGEVEIA